MDDTHKISILLAEYNALREEVLAARSYIAQAIGLSSAAWVGTIGFSFSNGFTGTYWVPFLLSGIILIYLVATIGWNEKNTRIITKRLRELEVDINYRAGEQLLVWETKSGWGGLIIRGIFKEK